MATWPRNRINFITKGDLDKLLFLNLEIFNNYFVVTCNNLCNFAIQKFVTKHRSVCVMKIKAARKVTHKFFPF